MAGRSAARSLSAWDWTFMGLLVGSVALVFWHEATTDATLRSVLEWLDLGLVVLFVGEWMWRVRHALPGERARYAARHSWELLGMVPLMAPAPGILRMLRLVRLVRILRVVGLLGEKLGTWERVARESSIGGIALVSGSITLAGATLVWLTERHDNPDLASFEESLWWAIVTVTTVGYGDITPVTRTGRIVAGMLMVAGIGTIGLLASSLASALVIKREAEEGAGDGQRNPSAPPAMAGRLTAELVALADLYDRGRLTEEEYQRAKELLLSG